MSKKACVAALTERSLWTVREGGGGVGRGGVWGGCSQSSSSYWPPSFFFSEAPRCFLWGISASPTQRKTAFPLYKRAGYRDFCQAVKCVYVNVQPGEKMNARPPVRSRLVPQVTALCDIWSHPNCQSAKCMQRVKESDPLPVSVSGYRLQEIHGPLKSENLENLKAENRALGCKVRSVKINPLPQICSISLDQTVAETHARGSP